jgi:hypothetical protein
MTTRVVVNPLQTITPTKKHWLSPAFYETSHHCNMTATVVVNDTQANHANEEKHRLSPAFYETSHHCNMTARAVVNAT